MSTTSDRRTAGGKMVTRRRPTTASRTPYAKPEPRNPLPANPNWISGLFYPAKVIASGAGRFLSFFGPDSSSSFSGSGDDDSEHEDDEEVGNGTSFQGDDWSNKALSSSKSDNKRAIEQLVMQETFSREEVDELIVLIKSRVVDRNAIMEARKWLQQKRSGAKKTMEHELDNTTLSTPPKCSPVDMAKSYMKHRPTWASPSLKQTEFGSPFPLGILDFKEETPKSALCSSEVNKNPRSSGSWNILEEIRRVRSRATEKFQTGSPLTKTGLSSFSIDIDRPQEALMNNRDVEGAAVSNSIPNNPQNFIPDVSASLPSRVNQDGGAVQSMEEQEYQEAVDLKSDENNELKELRSTAPVNGFPYTAAGLTEEHDATQKPGPSELVNGDLVGSSQVGTDVHMEDALNPKQDPPAAVSNAKFADNMVNGSQNSQSSSSMQQKDLSQDLSQPNIEQTSKAKANKAQNVRNLRGYTRKGRGRGK